MTTAVRRHPAAPTQWERETATRIRDRVARHATGTTAAQLSLLVLRAKIDGPASKLLLLLGSHDTDTPVDLASSYLRLREEPNFNRLFHLIRAAL